MNQETILEIINKTIRKIILEVRDDPLPSGRQRRVGRNYFLGLLSEKINKELEKAFEQEFKKPSYKTGRKEWNF